MMKVLGALALVALVSACTTPVGGQGFTDKQVPVQGEIILNSGETAHQVRLVSADGWTCTGVYDRLAKMRSKSSMISFPVACDNGDSGNAVFSDRTADLSVNERTLAAHPGRMRIAFSLKSGTKGYVNL